ncbi:MAG TPA: 2-C-methyl-D-erythritol 4-phosphate cytidylyltransferase [Candidatus Deferrimicrobiaceae bacterium]|nr:2-C-methyl-D-erythritol 4-phosphate cytidylyltransferase [Candidatus Deferrimicrobiaceae bacterium]
MPKVVAIVVAGGAGTRMGAGVPKQFLPLGGRPIVDRAISAFTASPRIDGILLALPAGLPAVETASYRGRPKVLQVVDGGAERQDSVANALASVPEDAEVILVHDAVRPFVSGDLLARCVDLAREHGAVVPVVPVRETVKAWDAKGKTLSTVDRSGLFRAQTPQAFRAGILRTAYGKAAAAGLRGTDDASLVEAAGFPVTPIPGEEANLKITIPEELRMAEGLLGEGAGFRIGLGGDAHRLVEGRELWLGGVNVEHDKGLLGHSDGDVLLHAIADAIYGAMGDGDIGLHFPPGREETRGISSRKILEHARGRMEALGFSLVGLDAVVVCEEPRIAPVAQALRASIAGLLAVSPDRVSLKGKTTEGMGFEGRKEGISAWAVALLAGLGPSFGSGTGAA